MLSAASFSPALRIRLLILQPTPFCNISCDYCYLAERDLHRFMSLDVVEAAVSNAKQCGLVGPQLSIVWHAGEPLVASREFYRQAFDLVGRTLGPEVQVWHSIQTNGTLIDERWCALFRQYAVRVGVSLDGPAFLHDRHRTTRQGGPTHARVMQGVKALQLDEIPFHVISVVTEDALDHADEIIDFFLDNGIAELGFNIDEQEGINRRSTLTGHEDRYQGFLRRIFQRAAAEPARLRVREFHRALELIVHGLPDTRVRGEAFPDNDQVLPFAVTTVNWEGDFSCFSPELIDQRHPSYGRFVFGNVKRDRLIDTLQSAAFNRVLTDILDGVRACRTSCQYFKLCGGGAPVNKLNENGRFGTAETAYCRAQIQAPLLISLAQLEQGLAMDLSQACIT